MNRTMSDENALTAAIIAHPEEDTPRLALADWLDEHGNPDRANFIRAQCQYATASATQPDYPEVYDNCFGAFARASWWLYANQPELPEGFAYVSGEHPDYGIYRRGFPYRARGDWYNDYGDPDDDVIDQMCAGLEKLVTTTTIRSLDLRNITPDQLERLLDAPGAEKLTGLWIGTNWTGGDQFARIVASSKIAPRLTDLALGVDMTGRGVKALTRAKFDRLESFSVPGLDCSDTTRRDLFATRWFRRLKVVTAAGIFPYTQPSVLAALARLPKLEKLFLGVDGAFGVEELSAAKGFPELGWLELKGDACARAAAALAGGSFPKLLTLTMLGVRNGAFRKVVAAPWFPRIRNIDVSFGHLNDKSVLALARSPAAEHLRVLQLCDNPISSASLKVLADRFPSLRRFDLDCEGSPGIGAADVRRFLAALRMPHLRDLYMDGWPLNTAGAEALAANPTVAGVTGLSFNRSGLTDRGFDALCRSPHLRHVELFKAMDNRIKSPKALFKRDVLPDLRDMWLTGNRISHRTGKRLKPTRTWVMEYADD